MQRILGGFAVLITLMLVGCASYTPTLVRMDALGPNVTKKVQGDLILYVEEYTTAEKSERAFDTDLANEGVLPLLILVENGGRHPYEVRLADILLREGEATKRVLTPSEAAGKAQRGIVGRAFGWSLILPIITIPTAIVASTAHTSDVNQKILRDFAAKEFPAGVIMPQKERSGFLFFEHKAGQRDLTGLALEIMAKNMVTGDLVTIIVPLAAAAPSESQVGGPPHKQGG